MVINSDKILNSYIQQIEGVQHQMMWMGANFGKFLKQVDDQNAFIQPIEGLHSVAQIIVHLTAWRNDTIVKLKTGKSHLEEDGPEDWPENDFLRDKGWMQILDEYQNSLKNLIEFLNSKNDDLLSETYFDEDFRVKTTKAFLVEGMLHHDIYHLGQLGITVKYLKNA